MHWSRTQSPQGAAAAHLLPSDFPTTMMRSALVLKAVPNPALAEAFVSHLILGESDGARSGFPLAPLGAFQNIAGRSSISLEPALMTYLGALKRQTFLREWESAIIQD